MDNKIHERIKMVEWHDFISGKKLGRLELKQLPVPGSIAVYLQGHVIQPESFGICGEPIISEEMTRLFITKQKLALRKDPVNNTEGIYALVTYEPLEFTIPKDEFDSVSGIQKSLASLKSFNEMLHNRIRYLKAFGDKAELSEYIVWGKYILDKSGKTHNWNGTVKNTSTNKLYITSSINEIKTLPDVCQISILEHFLKDDEIVCYGPGYCIPSAGSICPICGREISMYDIRTKDHLSRINGKCCHHNCLDDYEKQLQIGRITDIIDQVYDNAPTYSIVEKTSGSITLSFETPDGNIEIQDTLGAIAIEWKENFKPFDMAIFEKEEELKWYMVNDEPFFLGMNIPKNMFMRNARGILARHDSDKAARYLTLVKETVNETK